VLGRHERVARETIELGDSRGGVSGVGATVTPVTVLNDRLMTTCWPGATWIAGSPPNSWIETTTRPGRPFCRLTRTSALGIRGLVYVPAATNSSFAGS
jgi:hypothetical protein